MILNKLEFALMNNPLRRFIQDKIEIKELRSRSSLPPHKAILEIGCGSGYGTRLIQRYFQPTKIEAVDLDPRMIVLARKRVQDPTISFRVGSATKLPFKSNTFDAVIEFGIIHHIPNWKKAVEELYRVLTPGGELLLEDLSAETFETPLGKWYKRFLDHPYKKMYRRDEFIDYLQSVGFQIIVQKQYHPLYLLKYFVIIAQKQRR